MVKASTTMPLTTIDGATTLLRSCACKMRHIKARHHYRCAILVQRKNQPYLANNQEYTNIFF